MTHTPDADDDDRNPVTAFEGAISGPFLTASSPFALRDLFAAVCLAARAVRAPIYDAEQEAGAAYEIADAMLKARDGA